MISKAQTVVHKSAMMIETLHALVAVVAMERVFGPQIFTVDAYVVQVELLIH